MDFDVVGVELIVGDGGEVQDALFADVTQRVPLGHHSPSEQQEYAGQFQQTVHVLTAHPLTRIDLRPTQHFQASTGTQVQVGPKVGGFQIT